MQDVSFTINQNKQKIAALISEWGFNTSLSNPAKFFLDLYRGSGKASLCLLVKDSNPQIGDSWIRRILLSYELEKMLDFGVSVNQIENFFEDVQSKITEKSIAVYASDSEITKFYPQGYQLVKADLDARLEELGFTDQETIKKKIQTWKTKISNPRFPGRFYSSSAQRALSDSPTNDDRDYLLSFLEKDQHALSLLQKNPDLLLEVHSEWISGGKEEIKEGALK